MKFTDAVKATLKGYFNAGDYPTELQYGALMDAIQEGIEEHQHDSTGDGDGTGILNGPITMAEDSWQGIGAALERFVYNGSAGAIALMDANLGVGILDPGNAHMFLYDGALDSAATYFGFRSAHVKTAGAGGVNDDLYGFNSLIELNQATVIDNMFSGYLRTVLTLGTADQLIGTYTEVQIDAGTVNELVTSGHNLVDINAGTITGSVYGQRIVVDIEAAATCNSPIYGVHVQVDDDDNTSTSYMVYLDEQSNIDYGFYQNGAADNYFGGWVGIGTTGPIVALDVFDDIANFVGRFVNDGNADDRWGIVIQCGLDTNPAARLINFSDGNGTTVGYVIGDGAAGVTYFSASDERLKNILGPIDPTVAMKALTEVDAIQYVGKGLTEKTGHKNFGFSAQAMLKHFPEVVNHDEETDMYSISYERLVSVLWAQSQVLLKRIEVMEAK